MKRYDLIKSNATKFLSVTVALIFIAGVVSVFVSMVIKLNVLI